MKQDLKVLWKDIKRSPGLLIALIVVIIGVIYFVYKQNAGTSTTADSTSSAGTYRIQTFSITPPASGNEGDGTGVGNHPKNPLLTVRDANNYDKSQKHTGIAIHAGTDNGKSIGQVSYGQVIQATGPAVVGAYNKPGSGGNGSNLWYPITVNGKSGYISAYDIATMV